MFNNVVVIAEKRVLTNKTTFVSEEIDFSSANCTNAIIQAIKSIGYTVTYYNSPKVFCDNIKKHKNDIIMSTLWGGYHSRDKRCYISAICEANNLCFVGADSYVQLLCQDKILSKVLLRDYNFSIPNAIEIKSIDELYKIKNFNFYPCVVKPTNEGCSVGISNNNIVLNSKEAFQKCRYLLKFYRPIMLEEYIGGVELSICCAGKTGKKMDVLKCISLTEDLQDQLFIWGYEAKKLEGGYSSKMFDFTKNIPTKYLDESQRLFNNLGKVDCMRIDGRLYNNKFYIIELSPDCSLGNNDLMQKAFSLANYSYMEMFKILIENAKSEYFHRNQHSKKM